MSDYSREPSLNDLVAERRIQMEFDNAIRLAGELSVVHSDLIVISWSSAGYSDVLARTQEKILQTSVFPEALGDFASKHSLGVEAHPVRVGNKLDIVVDPDTADEIVHQVGAVIDVLPDWARRSAAPGFIGGSARMIRRGYDLIGSADTAKQPSPIRIGGSDRPKSADPGRIGTV